MSRRQKGQAQEKDRRHEGRDRSVVFLLITFFVSYFGAQTDSIRVFFVCGANMIQNLCSFLYFGAPSRGARAACEKKQAL